MLILADENVEPAIVHWLRSNGHDITSVLESGRGASDETVLARATRERRVLVTYDHDFGKLMFKHGRTSAGVVLLRLGDPRPAGRLAQLQAVWSLVEPHAAGAFVVVIDDRVRIRRLP